MEVGRGFMKEGGLVPEGSPLVVVIGKVAGSPPATNRSEEWDVFSAVWVGAVVLVLVVLGLRRLWMEKRP